MNLISIKNRKRNLEIKEYLKKINWHYISDNWEIQVYRGTSYKTITLNPYQDCSKLNPLFIHKKWLEWVYTSKALNLKDQTIAEICGCINNKTIGNWRKKFNIPTKAVNYYFKNGYKFLRMSKEYKHPELNPLGNKKIYRPEHTIVMEDHLNKTFLPEELCLNHCLVKNDNRYYIKKKCIVHHKNHIRLDNKIDNLWLYHNKNEHSKSNINSCFNGLIKLGQVLFYKGNYYINYTKNYRHLKSSKIKKIISQKEFINYKDLDLVKKTIKNMNWSNMDWNIEYQLRNNAPIEKIHLNPHEDCSEKNPLYRHKGWLKRIVHDKRFYLTNKRLGKLCGISERSARRWRWENFHIPKNSWGFDRYLGITSRGKKIIFKKISKDYNNPFCIKKREFSLNA